MKRILFDRCLPTSAAYCLILALGLFPACQSDNTTGKDVAADVTAGAETTGGASDSAAGEAVNPKEVVDKYIARVRVLEKGFDDFQKNTQALYKEVQALPAGYTKNARGFAELEERLANYPEKGKVMKEEVGRTIQALERALKSDWVASGATPPGVTEEAIVGQALLHQVKDLEASAVNYEEAYRKMEKAVARLREARGAAVDIFQE